MSALQEILHDLIHLTSMNQGQRDQMHDKVDQLEAAVAADVSRETLPVVPSQTDTPVTSTGGISSLEPGQ